MLSPGKHGAGNVAGKAGMRQTTARLVIDYVTWRLRGCQEAPKLKLGLAFIDKTGELSVVRGLALGSWRQS